jgi:hypothetical protein
MKRKNVQKLIIPIRFYFRVPAMSRSFQDAACRIEENKVNIKNIWNVGFKRFTIHMNIVSIST